LYEELSNLPPACSVVITTSSAGLPVPACTSTGMPRPLSFTDKLPSVSKVTVMSSQNPARASSTALSTTSQIRWCRPRTLMSPMYMAGRLRTASSPSSTVMLVAS
jgi:hypothetical protein